jgi:hypothetical protein
VDDVGSTGTLSVCTYPRAQDASAGEVQEHLLHGQDGVKKAQDRLRPEGQDGKTGKIKGEGFRVRV